MAFTPEQAIHALWLGLAVLWIAGALRTKPAVRSQGTPRRAIHLALLTLAATLLFQRWSGIGILGLRVIPASEIAGWAGLVLTALGVSFAAWARIHLGGNWSATVTEKQSHTLVRTGPYALVRHPIYTGCLLAMLGTAIAVGQVRCFVGFAIALATWWTKLQVEEQFMLERFGAAYVAYRREVKALIPLVL